MALLFVDTGGFYALADRSDRHHVEAAASFRKRACAEGLVTTDHVLVETWYLLRARLGRPAAMRFWEASESGVVRILGVLARDLARAHRIALDWSDQDFSIVDCTSFAVIERLGIERAMAFDDHFRIIRLGARRDRRLALVPGP